MPEPAQLRDVAPEEQADGPVGDDAQLPGEERQLVEVIRPREEPAREAAHAQAERAFQDALVAPEGRSLAEHPVPVGLQLAGEVLREASRLTERVLRGRRVGPLRARGVLDSCAVAERPDALLALDAQEGVDADAARLVDRQAELGEER